MYQTYIWAETKLHLGGIWSFCTRKIFGLSHKSPSQQGTVMGMAALGNPDKYFSHFDNMSDLRDTRGSMKGWAPIDIETLIEEAKKSEQNKFDIAASLQLRTEILIKDLLSPYIEKYKPKNLCLSGGVSLNCVSVGKMLDWFPNLNIFVDPIPYDAGLYTSKS